MGNLFKKSDVVKDVSPTNSLKSNQWAAIEIVFTVGTDYVIGLPWPS